jgi:hypothetical protein
MVLRVEHRVELFLIEFLRHFLHSFLDISIAFAPAMLVQHLQSLEPQSILRASSSRASEVDPALSLVLFSSSPLLVIAMLKKLNFSSLWKSCVHVSRGWHAALVASAAWVVFPWWLGGIQVI